MQGGTWGTGGTLRRNSESRRYRAGDWAVPVLTLDRDRYRLVPPTSTPSDEEFPFEYPWYLLEEDSPHLKLRNSSQRHPLGGGYHRVQTGSPPNQAHSPGPRPRGCVGPDVVWAYPDGPRQPNRESAAPLILTTQRSTSGPSRARQHGRLPRDMRSACAALFRLPYSRSAWLRAPWRLHNHPEVYHPEVFQSARCR